MKLNKKLDYSILREALYSMVEFGDFTFNQITTKTGVYNLKEITEGVHRPKIKTWLRLHSAFPQHIPEPAYTNGSSISFSAKGKNIHQITGGSGTVHIGKKNVNSGSGVYLTTQEQHLIDLIRESPNPEKLLNNFIKEIYLSQDDE